MFFISQRDPVGYGSGTITLYQSLTATMSGSFREKMCASRFQNQVKVATDGSFCADTTFVQTSLKFFFSLYDYVQGI